MSLSLAGRSTASAVLEKVEGLVEEVKGLREQNTTLREQMVEIKEKGAVAQYPPGVGPQSINGMPRLNRGISEGYSVLKATRMALGRLDKSGYEWDIHQKLKSLYEAGGWRQSWDTLLIPFATRHIPAESSEQERWVGELKHKMVANADQVDPDEVGWLRQKFGMRTKAAPFGTVLDNQGGDLVGFPTLMELIDIQRNQEVFAQAGATEQALPANGRMQYPKLTNTTTAFWVGEGAAITGSVPATGHLDLQGKKVAVLVDLNNELVRFVTPSAEALVRGDMAKVAALKIDLAMLEGTGGTQIKGLITYPSAATWTTGTDPLLAYTVTSNLLQIKDAAEMEALMPDTAGTPTAWVMRRQLWAKLRNRRADAVTAADNAGPYLASITRSLQERQGYQFDGTPVVRSTQVSATRGNGSQTYAILGYFPDWITARFGMAEFLASNVGDTQMTADQTRVRVIQTIDAGPRHASSFVLADAITLS